MPEQQSTPPTPPNGGAFGKAIGIVFMLIWTLGSAAIAAVFLGIGSAASEIGGPVSFAPKLMAIVPIGFVVIGIMMLIKMATTPANAPPPAAPQDVSRSTESSPPPPPLPAGPLMCPGCGSRKNIPGAAVCAYCGGSMSGRPA